MNLGISYEPNPLSSPCYFLHSKGHDATSHQTISGMGWSVPFGSPLRTAGTPTWPVTKMFPSVLLRHSDPSSWLLSLFPRKQEAPPSPFPKYNDQLDNHLKKGYRTRNTLAENHFHMVLLKRMQNYRLIW